MPRPFERMSDDQKAKISAALKARGKSPTKHCPACDETLDRAEFGLRSNGHSRSRCRRCEVKTQAVWAASNRDKVRAAQRRTTLRRYFGITVEQYDALLAAQDGRCAICGTTDPGRRDVFDVDHCHETQRIRGLLCSPCNVGLGAFRDDADLLGTAIGYLARGAAHDPDAIYAAPGLPSGRR